MICNFAILYLNLSIIMNIVIMNNEQKGRKTICQFDKDMNQIFWFFF